MARVTIDDCLKHIPNRFELVLLAVKRARDLALNGVESYVTIDLEKPDKPTVLALREIAIGMHEKFIQQYRHARMQPHKTSASGH